MAENSSYPLLVILVDACHADNEPAHKARWDTLMSILHRLREGLNGSPKVLVSVIYYGSSPPYHEFVTKRGIQSMVIEDVRKELSQLKCFGGGFGSCLWDGVAQSLTIFENQPDVRHKYLCVVPSSLPQCSSVRFVSKYAGQAHEMLTQYLCRQGVRVSIVGSLVIPELSGLFNACCKGEPGIQGIQHMAPSFRSVF
jgi:hypothetical protein